MSQKWLIEGESRGKQQERSASAAQARTLQWEEVWFTKEIKQKLRVTMACTRLRSNRAGASLETLSLSFRAIAAIEQLSAKKRRDPKWEFSESLSRKQKRKRMKWTPVAQQGDQREKSCKDLLEKRMVDGAMG